MGFPLKVFVAYDVDAEAGARLIDRQLRRRGTRTAIGDGTPFENGLPPDLVLQDLGACDVLLLVSSGEARDDPNLAVLSRLAESFGKRSVSCRPGDDVTNVQKEIEDTVTDSEGALTINAGEWTITSDRADLTKLAVKLAGDGRVTGTHEAQGMTGEVNGSWKFDPGNRELSLDLESSFGLTPNQLQLELELTGEDGGTITAKDAHGLASSHAYQIRQG